MIVLVAAGIAALGVVPSKAADEPAPLGSTQPEGVSLSAEQLDQLAAPIALYPDALVGPILTAATYPLEVVEAARWLEDPANVALKGDQLTMALRQQSWDLSVKSLVPFPELLRMMNANLQWTEQTGDAFLAQQADVMDAIQRLRQHAVAAGSLRSTPQQTVTTNDQDITIEPASPDVVYVPYYVPSVVYGPWPWPDYPPFYFPPPPDVFLAGAAIGFGIGFAVVGPLWGWDQWDWHGHRLNVVVPRQSPRRPGTWQHDPSHRRGVPYRDAGTAGRFLGQDAASRRGFRGFPSEISPGLTTAGPAARVAPRVQRLPGVPAPAAAPRAPMLTPRAAPAFESFGRGTQTRSQAARGSSSRSAPAPRAAPSIHGGGGGRHR